MRTADCATSLAQCSRAIPAAPGPHDGGTDAQDEGCRPAVRKRWFVHGSRREPAPQAGAGGAAGERARTRMQRGAARSAADEPLLRVRGVVRRVGADLESAAGEEGERAGLPRGRSVARAHTPPFGANAT